MKVSVYKMILNEDKVPYLEKEKEVERLNIMTTPEVISDTISEVFQGGYLAEEHVWMIGMNMQNEIIGIFEIAHGGSDGADFSKRAILTRALLIGANRIALVHNHPSFIPLETREDKETAKALKEACNIVGLELIDFIILGRRDYRSFMERGIL